MQAGWLSVHPDDQVVIAPLSDGGPGFVAGLHAVLGGEVITAFVSDPLGQKTPAQYLVKGSQAWIESRPGSEKNINIWRGRINA
jgi:glycerate kinase